MSHSPTQTGCFRNLSPTIAPCDEDMPPSLGITVVGKWQTEGCRVKASLPQACIQDSQVTDCVTAFTGLYSKLKHWLYVQQRRKSFDLT